MRAKNWGWGKWCQEKYYPSSEIEFKITMLRSRFLWRQWCIQQGWKIVFLQLQKYQKNISMSILMIVSLNLGGVGARSEKPQWVQRQAHYSFCYWDTFQPQNTCFVMPMPTQASLTVFIQCFSLTTSMHAKVCHFFLSEWYGIRRILRIPGSFSLHHPFINHIVAKGL